MKKNKLNIFVLFSSIFILGTIIYAAGRYAPGETLNPSCAPGDANCTVDVGKLGKFKDGGSGKIYYNDGNVGIGTTSPAQKLDVVGNAEINGQILGTTKISFDQGTNFSIDTNSSGLIFDGGDGVADFLVYDERAYTDNLVMGYNGGATLSTYDSNENLTIDPNGSGNIIMQGDVGIGTTNPGAKLDIDGGIQTKNDLWVNGDTIKYGLNVRNSDIIGINMLRWNDLGEGIAFSNGAKASDEKISIYATDSNPSHLIIENKNGNTGNVGIGTTSPSKKLDVAGDINFTGNLYKNGALFNGGASSINDLSDGKTGGDSVFLGNGAGANDDGSNNWNTGVGIGSLHSNTTGYSNTAYGYKSLYSATETEGNTAIGSYSLSQNNDGDLNTAIGKDTLGNNTKGSFNTALGFRALYYNQEGRSNTAIGAHALEKNTTDNSYDSGEHNVAIGEFTLSENTIGKWNVAIGDSAGKSTDGGSGNQESNDSVYIGYMSKSQQSGTNNEIVIGDRAVGHGSNTVTLGNNSITDIYSKGRLNLFGHNVIDTTNFQAWYTNDSHYGYYNGYRHDGKRGYYLGWGNGSSTVNLYLDNANRLDITGGDVYMGGKLGIGTTNPTNGLHIKNNTGITLEPEGNDHKWILNLYDNGTDMEFYHQGSGSGEHITFTQDGDVKAHSFTASSDKRLKKNIQKLEDYRDILKIDAVRFNWKKNGKADIGIIAQNVQKYFPEFVHKEQNGFLTVEYSKLAVPMLNLLQEQNMNLKKQKERLDKQEKEIQELREMVEELRK